MPNLRVAIVDMGSNTLKFSVTEIDESGRETIIAQRADTVRLAAGLAPGRAIADDRIGRAVTSMVEFDAIAERAGSSVRLCVGTAALRMASNGPQVVSLIEQATKWRVRIIDGDQEAHLAFRGLVQSLDPDRRYLVLDIGGGSTEAILVDRNEMGSLESLHVGSGTLADANFASDPPGLQAVNQAVSQAAGSMSGSAVLRAATGRVLILSGGNGMFLKSVAKVRKLEEAFVPTAFHRVMEWLATHEAASYAREISIVEERARMLPAGAAIVQAAIASTGPSSLEVRPSGIRGGLIAEWLDTHPLDA